MVLSVDSALLVLGMAASFRASPKGLCAVLYKILKRPSAHSSHETWTPRICELDLCARKILSDLAERAGVRREIYIVKLADEGEFEREILGERTSPPTFTAFICLLPETFEKTFRPEHPEHRQYRVRLLWRLAQIHERSNPGRSDSAFCACATAGIATAQFASGPSAVLLGLAAGQWAGNLCANFWRHRDWRDAAQRTAKALTDDELLLLERVSASDPLSLRFREGLLLAYDRRRNSSPFPMDVLQSELAKRSLLPETPSSTAESSTGPHSSADEAQSPPFAQRRTSSHSSLGLRHLLEDSSQSFSVEEEPVQEIQEREEVLADLPPRAATPEHRPEPALQSTQSLPNDWDLLEVGSQTASPPATPPTASS